MFGVKGEVCALWRFDALYTVLHTLLRSKLSLISQWSKKKRWKSEGVRSGFGCRERVPRRQKGWKPLFLTVISIMFWAIATKSRTAKIRQQTCKKCLILEKHENKKLFELNV